MEMLGNISLLDQPKYGFICSRNTRSSIILPCLDWAVKRAQGAEPVMSTFHSEMENAVLELLLKGCCPIIIVLGRSMYKKIPSKWEPLLDANRLLVISVCEQDRISKSTAFFSNQYICDTADTITWGFISPSSSLFPLYNKVKQKSVIIG